MPVFYEIGKEHLHQYADFGLTFVKLGEEATVDLTAFTLEGAQGARYRQVISGWRRTVAAFAVVAAGEVCRGACRQLRRVSDDWLHAKAGAEKGFSLGFFDEAYCRASRWP